MVDQRLESIESGVLSPAGPRTYLWRPVTRITSRPQTPVSSQSRTDVASPRSSGSSERPWVRWRSVTPKTSASVAKMSTAVVSASQAPGATPGARIISGMWPSGW